MNFDQMPTPSQFEALKNKGYLNTDFNPNPMSQPVSQPTVEPPMPGPVEPEPAMPEPVAEPLPPTLPPIQPPDQFMKFASQQDQALRDAAKAGEAAAMKEAAFRETEAKAYQQRVLDDRKKVEEEENQVMERYKALDEAEKVASDKKVDPDRYWSEKSTGQKILAGITLALGAYGAGFTGRNDAATVIQNQINADIDRQQKAIDTEKEGITQKRGIYKDMLALLGDKKSAMTAAEIAYLKGTEMQVAGMQARARGAEIKANAQNLRGQLQDKIEQKKLEFVNASIQRQNLQSEQVNPELLSKEDQERYVKGYGLVLKPKVADELNTAVVEAKNATSSIMELKKLLGKDWKSLDPTVKADAEVLVGSIQAAIRSEMLGAGTVSDADREFLNRLVKNPTKFWSLDAATEASLNALGKKIEKGLANKMSQYITTPFKKTVRDSRYSGGTQNQNPGGYDIVK